MEEGEASMHSLGGVKVGSNRTAADMLRAALRYVYKLGIKQKMCAVAS